MTEKMMETRKKLMPKDSVLATKPKLTSNCSAVNFVQFSNATSQHQEIGIFNLSINYLFQGQ